MEKLSLPHGELILYARGVISRDANSARVSTEFNETPTLPMLIEAAAQSSAALNTDSSAKEGYLVAMKNIELLRNPTRKDLEIEITHEQSMGSMLLVNFKVYEGLDVVSSGNLTIALSEKN